MCSRLRRNRCIDGIYAFRSRAAPRGYPQGLTTVSNLVKFIPPLRPALADEKVKAIIEARVTLTSLTHLPVDLPAFRSEFRASD